MLDPRIVLTAVTAAGLLALVVALRVIAPKSRDYAFALVPFVLAAAIWVPLEIRNIGLPVLFGLFFCIESVVAGAIIAAVTFGLGQVVPGGATVALLGVLAVVGFFSVRAAARHLTLMKAAAALVPGTRPRGDVEVCGIAHSTAPVALPASESTCVAWWVETSGTAERASSLPFQVRTDAGAAIVYPETAVPGMRGDRERFLSGDDAAPVLAAVGIQTGAGDLDDEPSVWLRWLEPGDEAYVIGRPRWEAPPAGITGAYRDSPALPTFRGDDDARVFVANGSEDDVRRSATWSMWQWAVWGAVFAAIALTQMIVP